jgi:hypothetical protein
MVRETIYVQVFMFKKPFNIKVFMIIQLINMNISLRKYRVEGPDFPLSCWRCILVHQICSLHFGLDLIMELTRH